MISKRKTTKKSSGGVRIDSDDDKLGWGEMERGHTGER